MARIDGVYLQNISTVEELRAAVERGFASLVGQLNRGLTTEDQDFNDHRLTGVGYPVDLHDAVNIEFLKNMLGRIALPTNKVKGGGVGGFYDKATFGLAIDSSLIVANDTNPHYIVACNSMQLVTVQAKAKVAPTGADAIFRIKKNGTTILSTNFTIPDGSTSVVTWNTFDDVSFALNDIITIDTLQRGSSVAGGTVTIVMKFKVLNAGPV